MNKTITLWSRFSIRHRTHPMYVKNFIKEMNKTIKIQPNFIQSTYFMEKDYSTRWHSTTDEYCIYELSKWKDSKGSKNWLDNSSRKICLSKFNPYIKKINDKELEVQEVKDNPPAYDPYSRKVEGDVLFAGNFLGY